MEKRRCMSELILVIAIAISPFSFAVQLDSAQIKARSVAFQQLEEKIKITGKPVSIIVRIDDRGAFHPGGVTDTVKLKAAQEAVLAGLGDKVSNVKRFESFPFLAYTVNREGLAQMSGNMGILSIQEDAEVKPILGESVPLIGAPQAWAAGYTGAGQYIAIIDTGVDGSHPFLDGKVAFEACFSDQLLPDKESICPNGQTYQIGVGAAQPCPDQSVCFHGTLVAGVAAGNDGMNFGVAPDAGIIAIQVFHQRNNDCIVGPAPCTQTSDSNVIQALDLVYKLKTIQDNPIAAVNISIGGVTGYNGYCDGLHPMYSDAIGWLKDVDVATVVAAGNEGYKDHLEKPACISHAISVGSVCDAYEADQCPQGLDSVAEHSNVASFISLMAPGAWITSSVPGGLAYTTWGTSVAAPHVAGAWALMKQRNPLANVDDVLRDIRDYAWIIDDTRSGGMVSGLKSLDLHFLESAPSLVDNRIVIGLEEPAAYSSITGVGNIRGWAIGPEGIEYVQYYVDGVLKKRIPYGGTRRDVGNTNPDFPGSDSSGFAQSYAFSGLPEGVHTIMIRAVSRTGKYKDVTNSFYSTRFHKGYFADPKAMDISGSSVYQDGVGILLNNIRLEGVPYDVRLEWQVPTQQFGIVEID